MKSYSNKYAMKRSIDILIHTIIGLLFGYFILHPFSMLVFWLEYDSLDFTFNNIRDIATNRILNSFNYQMQFMGVLYSFVGGCIGLISGLYYFSIKKSKSILQTNKQLLEIENNKANFLRMISHEIRTPLNGIIGPISLLKDVVVAEELLSIIDLIDNSVARLENFSTVALNITELKTRNHRIKKEEINIGSEIEKILEDLSVRIQEKNIEVVFVNRQSKYQLNGNLNLLNLGLKKVLENAVIYCDSLIEINLFQKQNTIICTVMNDGKGFSLDTLDNLFNLFSSAHEHLDNKLGLGFPLLKLIVEAHEGEIHVSNNEMGGALIKLSFPSI